ncbi:MAG: hypothetical protein ABWK05_05930 [Pyrobaculum sp.]
MRLVCDLAACSSPGCFSYSAGLEVGELYTAHRVGVAAALGVSPAPRFARRLLASPDGRRNVGWSALSRFATRRLDPLVVPAAF